tara:strand:+ start:201 stop:656 length:456 start_codon:yes stop_codon:yes gene_type:complete
MADEPDGAGGLTSLVEIGRFILTALAVALAIPAFYSVASLFTVERFSIEAFLAIGAISFILAIIGGLVIGLPTLWFLKRRDWAGKIGIVTVVGTVFGAFGGMLLSTVFWQGNSLLILAGLKTWALVGAIAGFVAAPVWHWLHENDGRLTND